MTTSKEPGEISIKFAGKRPIVSFGAWPHEVKILTAPEELEEWERRVSAILGVEISAKAIIQGGGCCCGGGGGMCDQD